METPTGFTVPEGFKHVPWAEVSRGDTVYTVGTHNGKPCKYGPYEVLDTKKRQLRNTPRFVKKLSSDFPEPEENLLLPV